MNISTATEHTEPNVSHYIGWHTPSDMSADEIADNQRASMIEAGSWNFRFEELHDREMARTAILRAYMKAVGVIEPRPSDINGEIHYWDIHFDTLTLVTG